MKKEEFIERYGIEAYNKRLEQKKQYRDSHKEEISEYNKEYKELYRLTKYGRAADIVHHNNYNDKVRYGFDTSNNVDADWIVNNVFSGQTCIYCGETKWEKLGVDRIDNNLPHIASNLVPCCSKCNSSRQDLRTVEEQIEYTKNKNQD